MSKKKHYVPFWMADEMYAEITEIVKTDVQFENMSQAVRFGLRKWLASRRGGDGRKRAKVRASG